MERCLETKRPVELAHWSPLYSEGFDYGIFQEIASLVESFILLFYENHVLHWKQQLHKEAGNPEREMLYYRHMGWCYQNAFCFREAIASYDKALAKYEELDPAQQMKDFKVMVLREMGDSYYFWNCRGSQREDHSGEAAHCYRDAAEFKRQYCPNGETVNWLFGNADRMERGLERVWLGPSEMPSAKVALIRCQLDVFPADTVREHLLRHNIQVTALDPTEAGSMEDLDKEYQTICIFGGTRTPNMRRFAYLFREKEQDRNPVRKTVYGNQKQKEDRHGCWFQIFGDSAYETLCAAEYFVKEDEHRRILREYLETNPRP